VFAIGRFAEVIALGASDEAARRRVETSVRADFDTMTRALRVMGLGVADPNSVVAASRDDVTAARRLFAAAEAALATVDVAEFALTVYADDGRPLAWDGRPSDLPPDRLQGEEAWFLAQGALGLRLVYVTPVLLANGQRAGSVAAERSLAQRPASRDSANTFRYSGPIAPVSIVFRFEGGPTASASPAFDVLAPSGALLFSATLDPAEIAQTRARWRQASSSLAIATFGLALALLLTPLLDWRTRLTTMGASLAGAAYMVAVIALSRLALILGSPAQWTGHSLFSNAEFSSPLLGPLLTSPYEFLVTAISAAGLVTLLLGGVEEWRLRRRRRPTPMATALGLFVLAQASAGVCLAALLVIYQNFLGHIVASTTLDLLHFSLHPWSASRLAVHVGLIVWLATALGGCVLILRLASAAWAVSRKDWRFRLGRIVLWTLPLMLWELESTAPLEGRLPLLAAAAVAIGLALFATELTARFRHGSQAYRLMMTTLAFMVPAMAFYPTLYQLGWQAKARLVETRYAPQAIDQRRTIQRLLQESLNEIDRFPELAELTSTPSTPAGTEAPTDRAFQLWRVTGLAMYPVTSSVEVYAADGSLISRFAFNLPDDLSAAPRVDDQACTWDVYEEVSPFFAEERRILHAGRAVCDANGQPVGSIVTHAMLDYANLPFILSQSPYVELMRPVDPLRGEDISGRDIEFAFYGWSRRPLYTSSVTAWPLDDVAFERVERSREPVWARLQRGGADYDVYLLNDRGGIYALGFPLASGLDHLVNLAEITVLAWGTHLLLLGATALIGMFSHRGSTARALLREVRSSFYRKLLLAFILATVIPVVALAVATRTYVADQMRTNVEQDAVRMASAARRVVEDLVAPRAAQQGADVDDNLMVWVSRLIDQDVNIFAGPRLLATSERNLFASGLLPTRTPANVYRAIALRSDASTVVREQIGDLNYLVAATPMATRSVEAMLTVPLTTRELQIEGQIDTLDRRVLLGALLFVFGGASIGYWLAERIADPVNRLTRATRRIASGDFDARVAASSSDELGRLVDDFSKMAGELQRQRSELERTHRLEAWAEMARQVAHEIKNPLTPIQLNAEHLRRINADRGQPLSPVLNECVNTILEQVALLRGIASEFSNFASSPTAKPSLVYVHDLLHDSIDAYRTGLDSRIRFEEYIPTNLPPVFVDRTLIARSLTNLVENALHAMPSGGVLTIAASMIDDAVNIRFSDTGVGMDAEALARAFEPYFSTKTRGTGLGLPIAKRNIELSGGTIAVASARDQGTTVDITFPVAVQQS
jgi:signal transduction histidine kinase